MAKRSAKQRPATPEPRTLTEAAVLLMQLDPGHAEELGALARGLKQIGDAASGPVREHALAAAAAAESATVGDRGAARQALSAAAAELEAAMIAADDADPSLAGSPAEAAAEGESAAEPAKPEPDTACEAAPDPMAWALEALAELDAAEGVNSDALIASLLPGGDWLDDAAPQAPAAAAADSADASLPADADLELLEGFIGESIEYLQGAEAALLALEANAGDVEAVNTVFRCFHTIKGTSAFMGLVHISELAHRAESLLSRVREGELVLSGTYADLALRSIDVLHEMIGCVRAALGGAPLRVPAGYQPIVDMLQDPEAAHMAAQQGGGRVGELVAPRSAAAEDATATQQPRAATAGSGAQHEAAQDSWVRVRTDRLDGLVDTIGELVIAHSMIAQDELVAAQRLDGLTRKVAHAGKIVRELQDLSISMRMVPLRAQFQKLARLVRDLAQKSGKRVELITDGEETEIDRNMVDIIGDPLVHMIRNAVDHGIESPAERELAGKSPVGTIRLSAFHSGGTVVVQLTDDGRGLNRERIVAKATSRGLVEPDRHLSDREIDALIFMPGFSTADQVTEISGRGVGMDVVRRNVESLRGRVEIESRPGLGVTFAIRLPLTLALTDGMLVRVGTERYIIPTSSIQMSFRPERQALSTVIGRGELVMLRGELLPIVRLHTLFDVGMAETDPCEGLLVVVGSGTTRCALLIDELLGQQQVVTKSLGARIGKVAGVSGGAILGDGRVGLIIDPVEIVSLARGVDPCVDAGAAA